MNHPQIGYRSFDSKIGQVCVAVSEDGVVSVDFNGNAEARVIAHVKHAYPGCELIKNSLLADEAAKQLKEYFAGKRQAFDLKLSPKGTEFQRQVWNALTKIPYGQTRSYADVAAMIGNPRACRAVGNANHHNPIPPIAACHRVISADGSLGGYAGSPHLKAALLEHEQKHLKS